MKIGKYTIITDFSWVQTSKPFTIHRFLCFWILKEVKPEDIDVMAIDKRQRFLPEGRRFRYYKAGEDISIGLMVEKDE